MLRQEPLKRENLKFWFEHWPIYNKDEFEEVKQQVLNKLHDYDLPNDIDIRIIGSDLKMNKEHIEHAGISKYQYQPQFDRKCNFKDNPLILSYHYPELNRRFHRQVSDYVEADGNSIEHVSKPNSLISQDPPFFSFYQGDFERIGAHILDCYGSFKDFNIITNIPYGKQVLHPKQAKNMKRKVEKGIVDSNKLKYQNSELQNLFRRFGRFCEVYGKSMDDNIYVVARKMKFSNPFSFEKFSNIGWETWMDFNNSGLNVNLLKLNSEKVNATREVIKTYIEGDENYNQKLI